MSIVSQVAIQDVSFDANDVLDHMDEAFFSINDDWNFTYLNSKARKILCCDATNWTGRYIWDCLAGQRGSICDAYFQETVEHQKETNFETYIEPLQKWLKFRVFPMPSGLFVYFQDVTDKHNLEEQLLGREERYQSLKMYNPDGICSVDLNGYVVGTNPALERLLGYGRDHLVQMTFYDWVVPDDRQKMQNFIAQFLTASAVHKKECQLVAKSGAVIDVMCTLAEIIIRDQLRGVFVRIEDITERKQIEERLNEANARYEVIAENAQDIIFYHTPDGVLEYVSPVTERLLGYSSKEAVGQSVYQNCHPDDEDHAREVAKKIMQGEHIRRSECRIRHKNGHYLWFEHTLQVVRDKFGSVLYILGVARNISERKQAEKRLVESEERYRTLVENSLNVIAVNDGNKWLYMNESGLKMFGAPSLDAVLGQPIHDFLHPDFHEMCRERSALIIHNKQSMDITSQTWISLQGERIEAEVFAMPVEFDGRTAVQLIIHDISDRKQAEQLLLQSEKLSAIGQLAAGVAHEIRNPLTSIKGFLQLLRVQDKQAEAVYFDIMEQEISRIELISSEMLMLAKPQALTFESQHVSTMLTSVITLLNTQALMVNVEIEIDCKDVSPIFCVENAIKQVFVNIIKNAMDAMPNGGVVKIRVYEADDSVVVEITDQGEGIPNDVIAKLGQPFFTTKPSGTGLGLMVSQKIVKEHGGTIAFSSKVGCGTTVRVSFKKEQE